MGHLVRHIHKLLTLIAILWFGWRSRHLGVVRVVMGNSDLSEVSLSYNGMNHPLGMFVSHKTIRIIPSDTSSQLITENLSYMNA